MKIGFTLNGAPVCVEAPGTVSLLTLLRDYCRLTGTKRGCDIGECGACTVLLDDRAVTSCMVMAGQVQGRRVVTIEGLTGHDGALSPLQQAFVDHFAVQCGFCTPGLVMSSTAFIEKHKGQPVTREEIRRGHAGRSRAICAGAQATTLLWTPLTPQRRRWPGWYKTSVVITPYGAIINSKIRRRKT